MADAPAPARRPWPRPVVVFFLAVYVLLDGVLWAWGSYGLFTLDLPTAGQMLTLALLVLLVVGWAWRWAVAAGYIGGRATARFGGA